MSFESITMKNVSPSLSSDGTYSEIALIKDSGRFKLYSAIKAGRRFILKAPADPSGYPLALLKREYEASLTLSHPGLAYVFTYEDATPVGPCIVMEHVDGVTLDKWLADAPSLQARKRVLSQLLEVVEYIHSRGVVHNDLAPQNILVTRDGERVKLIDFGFSDDGSHTVSKSLGGTEGYASPELRAGRDVDARSDIWSLGAIIRDLFGRRHARVASKCMRSAPEGRYHDVAALRRSISAAKKLQVAIAAILLAAALLPPALHERAKILGMERELQEYRQAEKMKEETLGAFISRLDEFCGNRAAQYEARIKNASGKWEKNEIFGEFIEEYNRLWEQLVRECPQELRPELMTHIAARASEMLSSVQPLVL